MLQRFDVAAVPATAWKNGGGSTRELVCRPAGADLDAFDWRVSIATIAQAGPFSAFPGVDRLILLLDGDGVHLHSAGGMDHRLDQAHVPFAFPGEVPLYCTLLKGESTDFNVMTRRSSVRAELRVLRRAEDLAASAAGLLLAARGPWQLRAGDGVAGLAAGQGLWWDAEPQGWQAAPQQDGAVLVWVRLHAVGDCPI
jgi:environmental stress-induced protein Ves